MKLKTIKGKSGNEQYTQFLEKEIDLIKKRCNISQHESVYFLCHHKWKEMFLINGIIYVANVSCKLDNNSNKDVSTMDFVELYKIQLHKDYPKILKDIGFEAIVLKDPRYTFKPDEFLNWIDMPSEINEAVDLPYYEIIKFLNSYSNETFKTDRYLFYPKWDGDSNFITNIYAFDIKNQTKMKLYIPDKWKVENGKWKVIEPQCPNDITVDDFGKNISNYNKLQCKKAFLKLANRINPKYEIKNYWLMELVKRTVQPIDELHEWSIHRVFCDSEFSNIWVYDHPDKDEEPYFMVVDEGFTKVAVLNFKSPTYHIKGIYKRGNTKAKGWELDEQYIRRLISFLNSPSERAESDYYKGAYGKYVKTNWQQLIFEYNHNTAGWGWGENGFDTPPEKDTDRLAEVEALPFKLQIPDYMELLKDKR